VAAAALPSAVVQFLNSMDAPQLPGEYDVFISHASADGDRLREVAELLQAAGLKVWNDEKELKDFESITRSVQDKLAVLWRWLLSRATANGKITTPISAGCIGFF
jgi:TIR domain